MTSRPPQSPLTETAPASPISQMLSSMDPSAKRELPMPAATKSGSIEQAQATLYLFMIKLRSRVGSWATERYLNGSQYTSEAQQFRDWLDSWEFAFSGLLSNAMPSMKQEDVDRCRILKANHLGCVVLAAVLESSVSARRQSLDRDCGAIIGLATAVLDGKISSLTIRSSRNVMSMAEPLQVVQSYCGNSSLRDHASHLLARHFNSDASDLRLSIASFSPASSVAASSPRSGISQSFSHSRASSQSRYSG